MPDPRLDSAPEPQPTGRSKLVPDRPFPHPEVMCKDMPDGWTLLVNFDIRSGVSVNRTGALIWRLADGRRTVDDIVAGVRNSFPDAPDSVYDDVVGLLATLSEAGLIDEEIKCDEGSRVGR